MKACFIGSHLGLPNELLLTLRKELIQLIEKGCDCFYCGCYGEFDKTIKNILFDLKKSYSFIKVIKIKPYYQRNKYISLQAKQQYKREISKLKEAFGEGTEAYADQLFKFEKDFDYEYYTDWYLEEKKFDDVILYDLEKFPPKARIIECNKQKVRECDYILAYCPVKYSNSWEIKEYAKKLNKKIINLIKEP